MLKGTKKIGKTFVIKDSNGRNITDATVKANTFNSYYSTVFISEGNIPHIQGGNTGEPFTTDTKPSGEGLKQ